MPQRHVHFATNRIWDRRAGVFGTVCEAPAERLWLGTITVAIEADPAQDAVTGPPDVGGFDDFSGLPGKDGAAAGVLVGWLAAAHAQDALPLLVVHGFDYDFGEACARAARFATVLEGAGGPRILPLAFTWPSNGVASLSAYTNDQEDCTASGPALARLIRKIAEAAATVAGRKPGYLAHSMGARVTRCAMVALASEHAPPPAGLFGQAVVIGGDEDIDALEPGPHSMRPLFGIADWTTIGVYPQDATLAVVSALVKGMGPRLGSSGPMHPPRPADRAYVVDYAYAVSPESDGSGGTDWNDIGHQYYRNDPRVLADLASAFGGAAPEAVPGRRWGKPDSSIAFPEVEGRLYVVGSGPLAGGQGPTPRVADQSSSSSA